MLVNPLWQHVNALTQALVLKMRERFEALGSEANAQEMISKQVTEYTKREGSVREDVKSALEAQIHSSLSGDTPVRSCLAMQKKKQQEADEWAKLFQVHITEGKVNEAAKLQAISARNAAAVAVLERQKHERKAREERERQEQQAFVEEAQAALKKWEAEEASKRALQHSIMERLKEDRAQQLSERAMRKLMAEKKRAKEEGELAARLAHEARIEFQREEASRAQAKAALKEFLLNNEVYTQMKEEAKRKQWADDMRIMQEAVEAQERTARSRQAQLDKLKAWQAKLEKEAQARPEPKRWIDPAILERYLAEREQQQAADEQRRKEAIKIRNQQLVAQLNEQVEQRKEAAAKQQQEEKAYAEVLKRQVAAEQAQAAAQKKAQEAKKHVLRLQLEEQMKESAKRRVHVAPMSLTEKLINKRLLENAERLVKSPVK